MLRGERARGGRVLAGIAVAVLGAQVHSLWYATAPRDLPIAVVQPAVEVDLPPAAVVAPYDPEHAARKLSVQTALSRRAMGARLIVWPESAFDRDLDTPALTEAVTTLAKALGACLIVNTPRRGPGGAYNTTTVISPEEGIAARYAKVRLVPFGEFIPFGLRPLLQGRYTIRPDDAAAGGRWHALDACGTRVGAAICFESTFPEAARALQRDGARLLIVQTNDAWLGATAGPEQHARLSLARAVETGCWLLRSAAGGVSLIADPRGRIIARAGIGERTVLSARVSTTPRLTPYAAGGWLLPWVCLVGSGVAGLLRVLRRAAR